jgi:hypothetical protein
MCSETALSHQRCKFYLKKGKGSDANLQVNYDKSTCANMQTFSYAVAAISTNSSPCSNVPIVRATSDNRNKQKAKGNLRYIYVMNKYVHT